MLTKKNEKNEKKYECKLCDYLHLKRQISIDIF